MEIFKFLFTFYFLALETANGNWLHLPPRDQFLLIVLSFPQMWIVMVGLWNLLEANEGFSKSKKGYVSISVARATMRHFFKGLFFLFFGNIAVAFVVLRYLHGRTVGFRRTFRQAYL